MIRHVTVRVPLAGPRTVPITGQGLVRAIVELVALRTAGRLGILIGLKGRVDPHLGRIMMQNSGTIDQHRGHLLVTGLIQQVVNAILGSVHGIVFRRHPGLVNGLCPTNVSRGSGQL